ncbi:MAG: vWA domain-containing protein [Acidobacteriota bacterium]
MIALSFAAPQYLALLAAPAILLALWVWRVLRRRSEIRRLRRVRLVPLNERFRLVGDLSFWFWQVVALALLIAAVARPVAPASVPRRGGVDLVVLQDASASMRVTDVARNTADGAGLKPVRDRWQRSMRFLRELGDALSWQEDRIALTAFAHIATPQIRLTRDPNTLFFFLDHLYERPPFRLEDDTTWDTNLELGVMWGIRVVEKDAEIHGRSANAAVFVVVSDGEAWSGEVANAVSEAVARGIPIHVVGVGTLGGAPLPALKPVQEDEEEDLPGTSRLERTALQRIAMAGQGQYFELDRDGDRYVANTIVAAARRIAPPIGWHDSADELYWWFLCAAAVATGLGMVCARERGELGLLVAGSIAAGLTVGPLLF